MNGDACTCGQDVCAMNQFCDASQAFGRTMMRVLALLCAVCGVASEAVNLTPDNFEKEVTNSGKSAFIKFLAPW
jgi:hypothetical protein